MDTQAPVITIDGPSGVGKGTISQRLAEMLGWHLLDSGALYRTVAYAGIERGVDFDDEPMLAMLAAHLDVQFVSSKNGQPARVHYEGEDISDKIRTEKAGNAASRVAKFPKVREGLLLRQKDFQVQPGLVAEGRDMGATIFPEAKLKLFLTASAEERARRRFQQLKDKGVHVKLADLVSEIAERDARDMNREVAPLVPADDAVVIDTTNLSIQEVIERVLVEVKRAGFTQA